MHATVRSVSSMGAGRWCRGGSRIMSRRPSATGIGRSTPPSSIRKRCGSKSRSGRPKCTRRPNTAMPRTGRTNRGSAAPPKTLPARPGAGLATSSKSSSMPIRPKNCSSTPGWRCTSTASLRSRRRVSCSSCPRARHRSTSPMPCTPAWATRRSVPRSTAASCRFARRSKTAIRSRS